MSQKNSKRVESVPAALLVEDSFKQLSERDFELLRAGLKQLFRSQYRKKSNTDNNVVKQIRKDWMKEINGLEESLRKLEAQLYKD